MQILGSLRLFLAASVVVCHTQGYAFSKYPDVGLAAVIAFFFLSGYLMLATFDTNYSVGTFWERSARFYENRCLRIFPLYWISLLAMLALAALSPSVRALYVLGDAKAYIQNVLLLSLNQFWLWGDDAVLVGPAWTLDIELQFYILVPVIAFFLMRHQAFTLIAAAVVSIVSIGLLVAPSGMNGLDRSLPAYAAFFSAGLILFVFRERVAVLAPTFGLAGLLVVGVAIVAGVAEIPQAHWLLAFGNILIISFALLNGGTTNAFDTFLGSLSYPLFITHSVTIQSGLPALFYGADSSFLTISSWNIACSLVIATLAALTVETLVDRLRHRVRRGRVARPQIRTFSSLL